PYWQVLSGEIGADQLRGRTIVVGLDSSVSMLGMNTPLHQVLPRAAIIASFASSLAGNHLYREPMWGIILQWLLSFGALSLAIWLIPRISFLWALLSTASLAAMLVFAEIGLLNFTGVWVHFALPALALFAAALATGTARASFRLAGPRVRSNDPVGSLRTL